MIRPCLFLFFVLLASCSSDDDAAEIVTRLEGNLDIQSLNDLQNPDIQSYKTIDGNLIIDYTYDIENLELLQNLEKVNGGIIIRKNNGLKSLAGLENITALDFLEIEDNPALISLEGFTNLTSVANTMRIVNNDALAGLDALSNLQRIGTQLFVFDNKSLISIEGLSSLEEVPQLLINNNIYLTNIDGLGNLISSEDIRIDSNDSLTDFCALTEFVQANSGTISFIARFNSYNPTLEDLVANNCVE